MWHLQLICKLGVWNVQKSNLDGITHPCGRNQVKCMCVFIQCKVQHEAKETRWKCGCLPPEKKKLGNCSQCASDLTSRCCHQIKLWRNWQDRCKSTSHQINSKYQYKSAHEFLCIIIQVNLFLVKAIISSSVCVFACCGGEGVSNAACTSIWQKMKSLNYHQTRWFMLVQAISLAQKISCSISWHAQSWTTY